MALFEERLTFNEITRPSLPLLKDVILWFKVVLILLKNLLSPSKLYLAGGALVLGMSYPCY